MHRTAVSANPAFTDLHLLLTALVQSKVERRALADIAKQWPHAPAVEFYVTKATQEAMDSSTALKESGIATQWYELVYGPSVFGRLRPSMMQIPFLTSIPREAALPGSYWVAEGAAKPISVMSFSANATLEFRKLVSVIAVTKEIMKFARPDPEKFLKNALGRSLGKMLDFQFLSPTISEIPGIRPASITSSGSIVVSTGSSAEQIQNDLSSMVGLLTTWGAPFWIMSSSTAVTLSSKFNTAGGRQFPDITATGGQLMGINVAASPNITGFIALIDASAVLYATDNLEIDVSDTASVEMSDTPIAGETSPITGAVVKSLFQNNLVAIKCEMYVNYLPAHSGATVAMAVSF